ncbi:hypothetical protein SLS58_010043, partial [Diplodia intermedia]
MLRADSGCTYGLTLNPEMDIVIQGGSSWSNISAFNDRDYGQFSETYEGDLSQNSYGRLNTSNCRDQELLFTTTVWNSSAGNFSFAPDFQASGNLCSAKYYMAETLVTATLSDSSSEISFDEEEYRKSRIPIPENLLDIYGMQNLTLSPNWTDYIALPDKQTRAAAGGLSVLLAALYDFDTAAMIKDEDFIKNATRIKQRLFGEVLQFSLTHEGSPQETFQGKITVIQPRIVVTLATAVVLALLLFHSFCLSLLAWRLSSLQRRPLNLSRNPYTLIGTATLVAHDKQIRDKFLPYPDKDQESLLSRLGVEKFYTSPNMLHGEPPFTPVVTISMSAMFQRGEAVLNNNATIERSLELRQIPWLFEVNRYIDSDRGYTTAAGVINNLYTKLSTNWMYSAILQLALNGSQPAWSQDGWSFVPLNLSSVASNIHIQDVGNGSNSGLFVPGTLVTVSTPAVRGIIDCTPYDGFGNISEALITSEVHVSSSSENITTYTPSVAPSILRDTPILSHDYQIACCANITDEAQSHAAIGYWSQINQSSNPLQSQTWPVHFATKWIYGDSVTADDDMGLYFTEIPAVQALRCTPSIQTASADVTVDITSGRVKSFTIVDEPTDDPNVWTEAFVQHESTMDMNFSN